MCSGTCLSHGQVAKVSLNHELEEQQCLLSSIKQQAVKGLVQTAANLTIERSEKGKLNLSQPLDINCLLISLHCFLWNNMHGQSFKQERELNSTFW